MTDIQETKTNNKHTQEEEIEMACIALKLKNYFSANNWLSVDVIKVEKGYYEKNLTWRKERLNAPSEAYLCKSMIMENTAFKPEYESKYYQRYYCVVIQYITKMNSEKLLKAAKTIQNAHCEEKVGKSGYNLRLLNEEDSSAITGYGYNGVTPFLFNKPMPILISDKLAKLSPSFFLLGGGHVDVKLRVSFEEFTKKHEYDVYAFDLTETDKAWKHLQE